MSRVPKPGTAWVLLALVAPATAWSHAQYRPFSVNRYTQVSFGDEVVRFTYYLTVGDLPAQKLRLRADDDGDGVLSPAETPPLREWMRGLLANGLSVQLDGEDVQPDPGRGELDLVTPRVKMFAPMRFRFQFEVPCPAGRHELVYHDRARIPVLEQTEVLVTDRPGVSLLRVARSPRERGVVRRMFWEEGTAPTPVWIRFRMEPGGGAAASRDPDRLVDDTGPLKRALADERLGFWGVVAALGLAFLLGSVHALSPGHGKTLVAAYLVGSRGKVRHAVWLGLIVTCTHIFSVVVFGLVALWASEEVLPERLAPWLSLAAGGIVLAMGGWMVARRWRGNKDVHVHPSTPGAVEHHGDHVHPSTPGAVEHHGVHDHVVRWGELLILGISGGMVPCLSATVVLLFAVFLGRIATGLMLIAAFSLGLAATLVILGILVVRGRHLVARWSGGRRRQRLLRLLPVFSAVAVTVLGAVMVAGALMQL